MSLTNWIKRRKDQESEQPNQDQPDAVEVDEGGDQTEGGSSLWRPIFEHSDPMILSPEDAASYFSLPPDRADPFDAVGDDTHVRAAAVGVVGEVSVLLQSSYETKINAQINALYERIENLRAKLVDREQKQLQKAERAKARTAEKATAVKAEATSVPELFPRLRNAQAAWGYIQSLPVEGETPEGYPLVHISMNVLGRRIDVGRQTAKNLVRSFVGAGVLFDTTPGANAAHLYEIRDPFKR